MQPRSRSHNLTRKLLSATALAALGWGVIATNAAAQSPAAPAPVTASETEAKPAPTETGGGIAISEAAARRLFGEGPAATNASASSNDDPASFGAGGIFDLVVRLLAVSAAIYGVVWLLRKWMQHHGGAALVGGRVRVLETVGLASNRLLYVVDLGDKLLLVGATPQQLSLLSEITDEHSIAAFRGTSPDEGPGRSLPFSEYLRNLSSRMGRMKANLELPDPALNSRQTLTAQRLRDHRDAMRRRRFEVFGEPTDATLIERAS